jgi:uncharacterized protein YfbU (UPF0304 family)
MALTGIEKLQLAMAAEALLPAAERELDPKLIRDCVSHGDLWALDWAYPGLALGFPTPPEVKEVCDLLDMWDVLERSFEALPPAEKQRVTDHPDVHSAPKFSGFDGNNEGAYHIANRLTRDLDRWTQFGPPRDMNSHSMVIGTYRRLYKGFEPIWLRHVDAGGPFQLTADEIIEVMRERVHPEFRADDGKGGWVYKRGS